MTTNQLLMRSVFVKTDKLSTTVPLAGELCIEQDTNMIKVGDGTTPFKDLPYVSPFVVDLAQQQSTITERAKRIIEENIDLIETNRFNKLFDKCLPDIQREVCEALIEAGFYDELKAHLFPVPRAIQDLFSAVDYNITWEADLLHKYSETYTHDQIDSLVYSYRGW